MDDQNRMMHYQAYGMGDGSEHSPAGQDDHQKGLRGHADINTILDQIMNITDQSLDEAQVSFLLFFLGQTFLNPCPHTGVRICSGVSCFSEPYFETKLKIFILLSVKTSSKSNTNRSKN